MMRLLSVVVREDRIIAVVKLDEGAPTHTSPQLMEHILQAFPDLPAHACVNSMGPSFGDVMNHTSVPHLLEHMIIDLQATEFTRRANRGAEALAVGPPLLKGVTKWTDEARGIAQVQVSMFDDLVALNALQEAVKQINAAFRVQLDAIK